MSSKNCLIVLFGGQSAEHYVSCVSARHVIEAANPELYDVIPVGIDRNGDWHLAEKAIEDLGTGDLGNALEPAGPMWNPMTSARRWKRTSASETNAAAGGAYATVPTEYTAR